MFMRFAINDGNREKLAQMFDKLPPDVFGQKSPVVEEWSSTTSARVAARHSVVSTDAREFA
jgi:hypothetical protein